MTYSNLDKVVNLVTANNWVQHLHHLGKNSGTDSPNIMQPFAFIPAGIYQLKVNNRNIRTRCEICSKLAIKGTRTTPQ